PPALRRDADVADGEGLAERLFGQVGGRDAGVVAVAKADHGANAVVVDEPLQARLRQLAAAGEHAGPDDADVAKVRLAVVGVAGGDAGDDGQNDYSREPRSPTRHGGPP